MVLDEHWGYKNSQGLYSSCQTSTLLFTHCFECASWRKKKILSKVKVKLNMSSGVLLTPVGCWKNYPLTSLLLTLSSPEVAGMGVGKNDTYVSLCQFPSFLVPSFCWTKPIPFICYLWPVNMERRSNYRPFRREYQSPFPTVLLMEWWVGPG